MKNVSTTKLLKLAKQGNKHAERELHARQTPKPFLHKTLTPPEKAVHGRK